MRADPPVTVRELQHEDDLRGCTVLASRGERLLRYRIDENRRMLQLLGHDVVLDADSLHALLADLDAVLAGRELTGSPEWPWERTEDVRTLACVAAQSSDTARMPDAS